MRHVRDLLSDLVERRLWPVALLLVAALVAVPLLLAKSPSTTATSASAPALPAPAGGGAAEPAVSLATVTPQGAPLHGRARDPFRQQHVPHKARAGAPVSTPTTSPGASNGSSGTSPSGSSKGSSGGATPHAPAPKTYLTVSIDVHFGKATSPHLHTHNDVPRLTPLPSATNPIVIFLGMRTDLKTAVFMVSSDVHAQGDGRCVPSRKDCETIELKEGQTTFLDVAAASGEVTQYELDLVKVTIHQTTSKAAAQAAYAHVSRAGAALLRHGANASADGAAPTRLLLPFRYVPQQGVLHIALRAYRAQQRRLAQRLRAARLHSASATTTPAAP
jgi:hypothetical protein